MFFWKTQINKFVLEMSKVFEVYVTNWWGGWIKDERVVDIFLREVVL